MSDAEIIRIAMPERRPAGHLSNREILARIGGRRCSCRARQRGAEWAKTMVEPTSQRVWVRGRPYDAWRCSVCRCLVSWRLGLAAAYPPEVGGTPATPRRRAAARWAKQAAAVEAQAAHERDVRGVIDAVVMASIDQELSDMVAGATDPTAVRLGAMLDDLRQLSYWPES